MLKKPLVRAFQFVEKAESDHMNTDDTFLGTELKMLNL